MVSWDEMADSYLQMVGDVRRGFNHLAADIALDMLGSCDGAIVVDVGAGEGSVARRLIDMGAQVIAVEPTRGLLDVPVAIERDAPRGIAYHTDRVEDLCNVASESVDAVTAILVFHHVADLDGALAEIARVLRPHGRLVVVIPHPWSDHPGAEWQSAERQRTATARRGRRLDRAPPFLRSDGATRLSLCLRRQNMCMAIIGTHALLYTSEPDAVRAIFRDVFGWKHVDDGHGWLIFALPPAELGIHPGEGPTFDAGVRHQVTLMCDDLTTTIAELRSKGVEIRGEPKNEGWGITTTIAFPGGLDVMLYQPRHATAI